MHYLVFAVLVITMTFVNGHCDVPERYLVTFERTTDSYGSLHSNEQLIYYEGAIVSGSTLGGLTNIKDKVTGQCYSYDIEDNICRFADCEDVTLMEGIPFSAGEEEVEATATTREIKGKTYAYTKQYKYADDETRIHALMPDGRCILVKRNVDRVYGFMYYRYEDVITDTDGSDWTIPAKCLELEAW